MRTTSGTYNTDKGLGDNANGVGSGVKKHISNDQQGRFPANIILDNEAAKLLDEQTNDNVSRFFYVAKPSKAGRNNGVEDSKADDPYKIRKQNNKKNFHPTVKPVTLMKYLCQMTQTPTKGNVLDPFMGIERNEDYFNLAKTRIENANLQTELTL
ncbi:MAG: hypothetical protein DRQ46_00395 [Gammaproteobacteria bacterium]|nr:MAG: hypothetical protein DRQ46_00395 [Gammaproteobacteria bacterium]